MKFNNDTLYLSSIVISYKKIISFFIYSHCANIIKAINYFDDFSRVSFNWIKEVDRVVIRENKEILLALLNFLYDFI